MTGLSQLGWHSIMSGWSYAYGQPQLKGAFKVTPEDFQVIENLAVQPAGEGEHIWLQITKRRQNTDTVAKALARHANVSYRDVGYSGLKDFNAITQQWFSIRQTNQMDIDWQAFSLTGVAIDEITRHTRKIKRGTHKTNHFKIIVREVVGDLEELSTKIDTIRQRGVPNYFGAQRFGRDCRNMDKATALLVENKRFKDRHLQSLIYSSARSWLFNCVVSARVKEASWLQLYPGEPANLDGTNSVFNANNSDEEKTRLSALDIHSTAPLWGKIEQSDLQKYQRLQQFESTVLEPYWGICMGLEKHNLSYQRRASRINVESIHADIVDDVVALNFHLRKGQFATSVLRELFHFV